MNMKLKDVPIIARVNLAAKGVFDIEVRRHSEDGDYLGSDFFPNIHNKILNQGLDALGGSFPTNYGSNGQGGICVGTGNTAPTATDTVLQVPLAFTANLTSGPTPSSNATAPYASINSLVYTFGVGAVIGNVAEVGMKLSRTSGTNAAGDALFSRALIQVAGSPGTISLGATDQLVVTYTLSWIYNSDTTGSCIVTTDGVPASPNNFTVRPCQITPSGSFFVNNPFAPILVTNNSGSIQGWSCTNTSLLPATGNPTSSKEAASTTPAAYTPGSFTRTYNVHWASATATSQVMYFFQFNVMSFQILFTTAFGPTAVQTMDFGLQMTWAAT